MLLLVNFACIANDDWQYSGFGTLGLTLSDSDRYGYRKDISVNEGVYSGDVDFLAHSLLGLQVEKKITDNIDFTSQAVLRKVTEPSLSKYFTLAFLRYSPSVNWSFRLGRTAPDIFFITDYRDINIAHTWAAVPGEVYGLIPYRHIDGLDITYTTQFLDSTFSSKIFTGVSDGDIAYGDNSEPIDLDSILGLSLTLDHTNWIVQAKHTHTKLANETLTNQYLIDFINTVPEFIWEDAEQFSNDLRLKNKKTTYSSISTQAYLSDFILTAEVARITSDSTSIPKLKSGYASIAYQFNSLTFYSVYAFTDSPNFKFNEENVDPSLIPELVAAIESSSNYFASNQKTFSLGCRWDLSANVAANFQWKNTDIDYDGDTLWINTSGQSPAETVNTYMLNVSFAL